MKSRYRSVNERIDIVKNRIAGYDKKISRLQSLMMKDKMRLEKLSSKSSKSEQRNAIKSMSDADIAEMLKLWNASKGK